MEKISGVYKITNKITGDFYIGSSKDIKGRWVRHKSPSRWKQHPKSLLYKDFQEYGIYNFNFEIIEETNSIREREQYFIDLLKPTYNSNRASGWNIERYKESKRKYNQSEKGKEARRKYNQTEIRKEYSRKSMKEYRKTEKGIESNRKAAKKAMRKYYNQLCSFNGEILTLNTLTARFCKVGLDHPTLEAKKYLIK